MDRSVLQQIERLAKPGITITYTELNNTTDKSTVSDPKNEIAKAIKANKIGEIILAIYKNTRYKGKIGVDNYGKMHIIDQNDKIHPLTVKVTNESLSVWDPINNKKTVLQYTKKTSSMAEKTISLQDQLLTTLKKRKYSDKEVLDLIKNMSNIATR